MHFYFYSEGYRFGTPLGHPVKCDPPGSLPQYSHLSVVGGPGCCNNFHIATSHVDARRHLPISQTKKSTPKNFFISNLNGFVLGGSGCWDSCLPISVKRKCVISLILITIHNSWYPHLVCKHFFISPLTVQFVH